MCQNITMRVNWAWIKRHCVFCITLCTVVITSLLVCEKPLGSPASVKWVWNLRNPSSTVNWQLLTYRDAFHPGPPQRQDTWSLKVWCRLWNPVSRMSWAVCWWNCPHPGDKDERPPKTEFSTNSCGRPWTSCQNGQCQSDSPRGQYVTMQDPWVHRNQDTPPGHQPRPGIWAPPSMTNCCYVTAGTWPWRINLIRLMKWLRWSRKLATLQHI